MWPVSQMAASVAGAWFIILTPLSLPHPVIFIASSHGFVVGHVVPEAQVGGPIALVKDNDMIHIDAEANTISVNVSPAELAQRREAWTPPPLKVTQGTLFKYARIVEDASHGCITDASGDFISQVVTCK